MRTRINDSINKQDVEELIDLKLNPISNELRDLSHRLENIDNKLDMLVMRLINDKKK